MHGTAITIIDKSNMSIDIKTNNNHDDTKYILLVDDEKDILDLFTEYLTFNELKIIYFQNPLEALNFLNCNINNCSLVITDYSMPQMSGLDFIKHIRNIDRNFIIKIILITSYIKNNLVIDKSSNLRIDKIIEKPIPLEKLKDEVKLLMLPILVSN
jgi:response regulator RpfG family c-di-GMP phosphodiesterase